MSILNLLDRPIAYHRPFAAISGSICGGVFLSQAFYWSQRTSDPDGWFWKTQEQWFNETFMSRYEQETARKKLIAIGVLEQKRQGLPAKLFYRIDREALEIKMQNYADKYVEIPHTGVMDSSRQVSGKPSDNLCTENTSESTSEINTPLTPKGEEIAANQTSLFFEESQDQKTNPCQNSKSINQDIPPRPPSQPPKLTEADFDRFWEIVKMEDGKSGKAASLKKFLAIKGVSADTLIQARIQQQEWHRANRGVLKYLSVPNNWLRDGRWEDEMKSSIAPSQHSSPADLSLVRSPSELAATDQEFDSWWNRYLAIVSEINDIPCQGDRNQALNAYKELLMAGCTEEMLSRSLKAYYDQSKERWLRGKQVFMTSAAKFLENDTWKVAIAKDEVKAPTQAEQTNTAWADRLRAKHGAVAL